MVLAACSKSWLDLPFNRTRSFQEEKLEKCVTFFVKLITFLVKVPGTLSIFIINPPVCNMPLHKEKKTKNERIAQNSGPTASIDVIETISCVKDTQFNSSCTHCSINTIERIWSLAMMQLRKFSISPKVCSQFLKTKHYRYTLPRKIQSTQKVTRLNQNEAQWENKLYYFSYLFKGEFKTISKCHDDNSKNLWLITVTWYLQKSYSRALTHVWKTRNLNYFLRITFER